MDEAPARARHVVLVGMMGAGKTTAGRQLAARLGRRFVDLDEELERRSGRSVPAWFADQGEAAFRDEEARVLTEVLAGAEPVVAAAGGGVVCREANRERLRQGDVAVVWLDAPVPFLVSRLAGAAASGGRPLLADDPGAAIERLAGERRGWYADVADLTVDVRQPRLVDAIVEGLGS